MTTSTTGGTELVTIVAGASDDQTSRGSTTASVPSGAVLTKVSVKLWSTTDPAPAGKHQCLLMYLPGATAFATPIASWFNVTNPLVEEAIQIRRAIMGRSVHTQVVTGTTAYPVIMHCFWKGKRLLHDGDSVRLVQLDAVSTAWTAVCDYTFVT